MKQSAECASDASIESPPARGRGLKHHHHDYIMQRPFTPSPPARGRGLKPGECGIELVERTVAPRAGAWIET